MISQYPLLATSAPIAISAGIRPSPANADSGPPERRFTDITSKKGVARTANWAGAVAPRIHPCGGPSPTAP